MQKSCKGCGVKRVLMVKAEVKELGFSLKFHWLCFRCLLKECGLLDVMGKELIYHKIMQTADGLNEQIKKATGE